MSTRLPRDSSTIQEVRNSSYLGLFSIFGWKWSNVRVPVGRPSPRRAEHCLGKDTGSPGRSLRLGEGVHLGEGMYA